MHRSGNARANPSRSSHSRLAATPAEEPSQRLPVKRTRNCSLVHLGVIAFDGVVVDGVKVPIPARLRTCYWVVLKFAYRHANHPVRPEELIEGVEHVMSAPDVLAVGTLLQQTAREALAGVGANKREHLSRVRRCRERFVVCAGQALGPPPGRWSALDSQEVQCPITA